jgi:hypothetical protein
MFPITLEVVNSTGMRSVGISERDRVGKIERSWGFD